MPPIATLPIVVQRGSYRLQLSNLKITDEELPQLLQRATSELTNSYSQAQGKRSAFADVPLIEVTFNKNQITDVSCEAIVNFIGQNKNVQSVELLGNGLTDVSAPHIVRMITTLPVQRLKVGDNAFTAKGAAIIADALRISHKGFLQLHMGGNPIGDEGVKLLCEACNDSRVEVLGLRDVGFGAEGWEALGTVAASATTGVHDFQLRGNPLTQDCATAFGNGIARASLGSTHAFKLTVLSIGNCSIDGTSAKALFSVLDRAHNLVQIDLSNNPFGDEGITHLVSWLASGHKNHLQWLSLQKSAVTAAGIYTMSAGNRCDTVLAALKYLDLSLNNLGEGGAPAVATIIQWGMVLEKINLRRCMLEGPRLSEICSAVNHHPTLKEIDFASNFSGTENAKHWADIIFATTKLEHVVLTDNAFTSEDTAEIVQSLVTSTARSLSVLQLGGQSHVPPLGNVITAPVISKLNEALSRNRHQANDTKRPAATIQFDPVKLRQSLGYAGMPVPVPRPGRMHPDCAPLHPQLVGGFGFPNSLQAANGNFVCFAPQSQPQQPQYFMCTPLAGPAVYGACSNSNTTSNYGSNSTNPYTVKLLDPSSPNLPTNAVLLPQQHQPFSHQSILMQNGMPNMGLGAQQQQQLFQQQQLYHQSQQAYFNQQQGAFQPHVSTLPQPQQQMQPPQYGSGPAAPYANGLRTAAAQHSSFPQQPPSAAQTALTAQMLLNPKPTKNGQSLWADEAAPIGGSFGASSNSSVVTTGGAASTGGFIGDTLSGASNGNRANPFGPSSTFSAMPHVSNGAAYYGVDFMI